MILYVSRFMLNRWKLVLNGAAARIRVAAFPYALGAVYEIVINEATFSPNTSATFSDIYPSDTI